VAATENNNISIVTVVAIIVIT